MLRLNDRALSASLKEALTTTFPETPVALFAGDVKVTATGENTLPIESPTLAQPDSAGITAIIKIETNKK